MQSNDKISILDPLTHVYAAEHDDADAVDNRREGAVLHYFYVNVCVLSKLIFSDETGLHAGGW
jgi:hypothetical protein